MLVAGALFAIGLLAVIRLAYGKDDLVPGEGATMISLITAPLESMIVTFAGFNPSTLVETSCVMPWTCPESRRPAYRATSGTPGSTSLSG